MSTTRGMVYKLEAATVEVTTWGDSDAVWAITHTYATAKYGRGDDYTWRVEGEPPALGSFVQFTVEPQ